jgi:hypothetical protein
MYAYTSGLGASVAETKARLSAEVRARAAEQAKRTVQTLFLELLLRDPFAQGPEQTAGAMGYVNCLAEGSCDVDFVRSELIRSAEYKDKELARARAVYGGPAKPGAGTTSPASVGGLLETTIGGIPLPYLAGGLVLLMLLKRR